MSGLGKLEITDGQILAFQKPAKTLEELGIEGFKFHRALLNFNINGPSVYILPGSMITSHPDDSLYRYISFDGVIASDGKIDLFCLGNVNAKALNALTKALKEVRPHWRVFSQRFQGCLFAHQRHMAFGNAFQIKRRRTFIGQRHHFPQIKW
jgi:hypothetical protein